MSTPVTVAAPMAGRVVALADVPDPVFAETMLGEGLAIDPLDGLVRAPLSGRIATLHPARHALTLEADAGPVLLVHVGLETVALDGEGFTALVAEGARVAAGEPLLRVDLDAVGRRAKSLVTPVVLTNGEQFALVPVAAGAIVAAGDPLVEVLARGEGRRAEETDEPIVTRALVVPLRHGLHARPAARLAETAKTFDAKLALVAADGRRAALSSPVAVLALALRHGTRATLEGSGPEAEPALEAVAAMIEGGMGEGAPLASSSVVAAAEAGQAEPLESGVLVGVAAAPGIAIGPAWRAPDLLAALPETGGDAESERAALAFALGRVHDRLLAAAEGEGPAAAIASAHLAMLADEGLREAAEAAIGRGRPAGRAWREAVDGFAAMLGGAGDARFAERVDDLEDIARQVIAALAGERAELDPPPGAILAAAEVLPSQLLALAGKGLAGVAAGGGGPTGHAAIIAASLGLPMLAALGPDVARIAPGTRLLLDAGERSLTVAPGEDQLRDRREQADREAALGRAAQARAHEPAMTRDGTAIEVFANLGSLADATAAVAAGAQGCGLLRTEFAFLDRTDAPGEDEQARLYGAIAEALGERPLIVRTLDIGADKPAPWLALAPEENPALGLRGLRVGLARPELLRTQLRALLRAGETVRIMLPMVVEPDELAAARRLLVEEATALGLAVPPLGVMVETPSAALLAPALAREADFFSIGTNDLSQYALAMDRTNPALAARLDALHPAVLGLVAATVKGAQAHDRWVGVCGGLAADRAAVPLLLGLGVTELSVPPSQVALVKAAVRDLELPACRDLAARALVADGAEAVRALVRSQRAEEIPA